MSRKESDPLPLPRPADLHTKWLNRPANRRITLHFTPTHSSWMNLVEVFFAIITRQAIRRGSFTSVRQLVGAIRRFIDAWNERCEPFVWTKTADEILAKATVEPRQLRTTRSAPTPVG